MSKTPIDEGPGRPPMSQPEWLYWLVAVGIMIGAVYLKGPEILRKVREEREHKAKVQLPANQPVK